ncbi:MAG: tetratricopeptide repeat protein [Terriglobia bacterium]
MRSLVMPSLAVAVALTASLIGLKAQPDESPSPPASLTASQGPASSAAEFDQIARRADEARQAQRLNEAIELYQQGVRLRPEWHEGWWNLGTVLYSVDRVSEARDAFARLTANLPQHGPSWAFMGLCEMQLKDYERAVMDLDKGRQLGLGDNKLLIQVTHYNLGILFSRFGRFEQAYASLRGFASERNEEPSVIEAMGISILRMPYLPEEVPADKRELVLMAGRAAYKMAATDYAGADKVFQEVLARYPRTPNLHYAYGVFLIASHHPEKAHGEFLRELELTPAHVPARLQIAQNFMFRAEYSEALPLAREAVKLAPNSGNARSVLGRALLGTGEIDAAIRELETGVRLEPENPELHSLLVRAYSKAGRKEDSLREAAEFERLDKIQRRVQFQLPKANEDQPEKTARPPQP